jgi:hypothetical protein
MPMLRGAFPENFNGSKCTVSVSQENKMFLSILNNTTNVEYLSSVISKLVKKMITLEFEASEVSEDSIDKEERIKNFFKDFNNVLEIK